MRNSQNYVLKYGAQSYDEIITDEHYLRRLMMHLSVLYILHCKNLPFKEICDHKEIIHTEEM